MAWILPAAQIAGGLLGAAGQAGAARDQRRYMQSAARINNLRAGALSDSIDRARNYDPRSEDMAAADYATATAGDRLSKNLASLNQTFGAAAGNDTLFRVRAQGAVNRVADPLKEWLATQRSTETARKVDMLGSAIGQGGDLAQNYVAQAQQSTPDYSGAAALLNSGLSGLSGLANRNAANPMATRGPIAPGGNGAAGGKFNPANYDVSYVSPLAKPYR